jgi:hypothetical protein
MKMSAGDVKSQPPSFYSGLIPAMEFLCKKTSDSTQHSVLMLHLNLRYDLCCKFEVLLTTSVRYTLLNQDRRSATTLLKTGSCRLNSSGCCALPSVHETAFGLKYLCLSVSLHTYISYGDLHKTVLTNKQASRIPGKQSRKRLGANAINC